METDRARIARGTHAQLLLHLDLQQIGILVKQTLPSLHGLSMATWFDRDPQRLEKEIELMREFTRAQLRQNGSNLFWVEDLVSVARNQYRIAVNYPDRFPFERPQAFVLAPDISNAPHRLGNGSLCLFHNPWASDVKTTALVVRNRTVAWILAHEIWKVTGKWMAPQH